MSDNGLVRCTRCRRPVWQDEMDRHNLEVHELVEVPFFRLVVNRRRTSAALFALVLLALYLLL